MEQQNATNYSQLHNSTEIKCEKCDSILFVERLILRKISKLLIGADKDQVIPIPVIACAECNHVNTEFLPEIAK